MKKIIGPLFFFIAFFCCIAVFSGASLANKTTPVRIYDNKKPVFDKTYDIELSAKLNLFLFYGNDKTVMLKNKFSGDIKAYYDYLNPKIFDDVKNFCESLDVESIEPEAVFNKDGTFTYIEGKNGRKSDLNKTLLNTVYKENAEIVFYDVLPKKSVEELKENTKLISSFSTSYSTSKYERKKNVELACERLDGSVILPGERISFNETVGKRTKENGFYEAKVIKNGTYTTGVGGGVCQVSTTLYDAWLYTGQDVLYSRPHSLVPSYVTPGLDAMVSDSSDLVLVNSSLYPMYIDSFCDGKKLTFRIFGSKPECEYKLRSELIKTIPYDEYDTIEGEEDRIISYPKSRQIYRSYRVRYENGKETDREILRISDYLPQKGKKSVKKADNDEETDSQ